jgi:hypothetical protein
LRKARPCIGGDTLRHRPIRRRHLCVNK